jgi:hypothetical protein
LLIDKSRPRYSPFRKPGPPGAVARSVNASAEGESRDSPGLRSCARAAACLQKSRIAEGRGRTRAPPLPSPPGSVLCPGSPTRFCDRSNPTRRSPSKRGGDRFLRHRPRPFRPRSIPTGTSAAESPLLRIIRWPPLSWAFAIRYPGGYRNCVISVITKSDEIQ